jgi:hypothetical protein
MRYPILLIICFLSSPITTETAAWADHGNAAGARETSGPPAASVSTQRVTPAESKPAGTDAACKQRPWHCGVSRENKKLALSLYQEGNMLFDDSLFKAAADKYRAALALWRHPSIYYNLMLSLVALDRPIDAYQYSLGALQYGALPLGTAQHRRALDYHKLLRGRVAVLEVTSKEPGAEVFLNGKLLFQGPGTVRRLVEPGQHELVARKPHYLLLHGTLTLAPDKPLRAQLTMLPEDQSTIAVRRWEHEQPWTVAGIGLAVGLVGGALEWSAIEKEQSGENSVGQHRLGRGLAIAGAATAVTGLVLALHNRPRRVVNPARHNQIRLSVAPDIGRSAASVLATADF